MIKTVKIFFISLIIHFSEIFAMSVNMLSPDGLIQGEVIDMQTKEPLAGVNILVSGSYSNLFAFNDLLH